MSKTTLLAALCVGGILALTGCAAQSDQQKAHNGCMEDAKAQLPDNVEQVNTEKVETVNMSETMRELAENPLEADPEASVLWVTTGDMWYRIDGKDTSASVMCMISIKAGQPEDEFEATVTFEN